MRFAHQLYTTQAELAVLRNNMTKLLRISRHRGKYGRIDVRRESNSTSYKPDV